MGCQADLPAFEVNSFKSSEKHINIRVNGITDLKIPLSILPDSEFAPIDGLFVNLKNHGVFSASTLTSNQIGLNIDMRLWPIYILGEEPKGLDQKSIDEIKKTVQVLDKDNQHSKKGQFDTKNGIGYISIGKDKSIIYLTSHKEDSFITQIHTKGMSEEDIKAILLQGTI
jgi:hypothetical protein